MWDRREEKESRARGGEERRAEVLLRMFFHVSSLSFKSYLLLLCRVLNHRFPWTMKFFFTRDTLDLISWKLSKRNFSLKLKEHVQESELNIIIYFS